MRRLMSLVTSTTGIVECSSQGNNSGKNQIVWQGPPPVGAVGGCAGLEMQPPHLGRTIGVANPVDINGKGCLGINSHKRQVPVVKIAVRDMVPGGTTQGDLIYFTLGCSPSGAGACTVGWKPLN